MAAATAEAPKGKEEAKPADNGKAAKGKGAEEAKPAEGNAEEGKEAAASAAKSGGGLKTWMPLIATIVVMPALAFATTRFLLLPKLTKGLAQAAANAPAATGGAASEAPTAPAAPAKGEGKSGAEKSTKATVQINKLLVNVAGTMGTRYLMTSLTLAGNGSDFSGKIEDNLDQLKDLANSTLSSKTIADLEKPGARNVIRAELMTVFNNALGEPLIQEIYITEMAIQ
jgi:flagellar FliL protein